MRRLRKVAGGGLIVAVVITLLVVSRGSPALELPTPPAAFTSPQAYYIKSDGPIAAYGCPDVDCEIGAVLPGGSPVTVIGAARGDAMRPIQYRNQIVLYVIDSWLSVKPVMISNPLRPRGGASAICRDGWASYSAHRSGTCSHHGGVARWYAPLAR